MKTPLISNYLPDKFQIRQKKMLTSKANIHSIISINNDLLSVKLSLVGKVLSLLSGCF